MSESPRPSHEARKSGRPLPSGLLPCLNCGYDLRGCPPAANCPECGTPYRRASLYVDVARQRLRDFLSDAQFILVTGVAMAVCAVGALIIGVAGRLWKFPLSAPSLAQIGMLLGMFYVLLLIMYVVCWLRLLWEIRVRRSVHWAQVVGVGLSNTLLHAGIALAVPLVAAMLLI